jgi:hypothetical protein
MYVFDDVYKSMYIFICMYGHSAQFCVDLKNVTESIQILMDP